MIPTVGSSFDVSPLCWKWSLRHRWVVVVALSIVIFVLSLYGFTRVEQSFFPPALRPQFMVDCFLPAGTHIRESERFAESVGEFVKTSRV
jgi:multidrug efflux pump subunit AcrB